ncbi:MAG: hypothetical protein ACYCO3_10345, partial [Mycobacteriales bacterium]
MARLAEMELRHRWAGWDKTEFAGESTSHVSAWRIAQQDGLDVPTTPLRRSSRITSRQRPASRVVRIHCDVAVFGEPGGSELLPGR